LTTDEPPERLEDYNISVINSLVGKRYIESETFDFKGKKAAKGSELSKDFCAMANTRGGIIVLGIKEVKNNGFLERFMKEGFRTNVDDEDKVKQFFGNNMHEVEPTPRIDCNPVYEQDDSSTYYMVIRIDGKEINRPYFLRSTGQCYVRIGNSSKPASRSVILNLFSGFIERRRSARSLLAYTEILKEALIYVSKNLEQVNKSGDSRYKIAPLDLIMFRTAVAETFWLLSENDLMGRHISLGPGDKYNFVSSIGGINFLLGDMELLNYYINSYNLESNMDEKAKIIEYIGDKRFWKPNRSKINEALGYCDRIIQVANDFLSKNN
jgi:hypothetical protein